MAAADALPTRPGWRLRTADAEEVRRLARRTGLSPICAHLLVLRGHRDPEAASRHLEAPLASLAEPTLFPGMDLACERIARALRDGETILVHGDYDVDGISGTVLLMRLLRLVGAKAVWHIPNRFSDGYSFGDHSIARAEAEGCSLVISVDNGTSSGDVIAGLSAKGIDTIVTDHHEPPAGPLPPALAILNPKLRGSSYPFRELCGSGVAFKLAWAVCAHVSGARRVREDLRAFLLDAMAWVALATVCDVVPLVGENRVLARRGLEALSASSSAGVAALLDVAGLRRQQLTAEDVAFKLGPRLNAGGRLGCAEKAVELLLSDDPAHARSLARELDALNEERRRLEAELRVEAFAQAERYADPERYPMLVLAGQGWHQGIVGIVAARVATKYARPALVIGLDGEKGRGSARSRPGFDVLAAMEGGRAHMDRFGGHAAAAGCEVRAENIEPLREAIAARAGELVAVTPLREPDLELDLELPLADMSAELMDQLDRLRPFGEENPKPVLLSRDVHLASPPRIVGGDRTHLMLHVRDGERVFKAMVFGAGHRADELALGRPFHLAWTPRWNTFRGQTNLELEVHGFHVGPLSAVLTEVAPAAGPARREPAAGVPPGSAR